MNIQDTNARILQGLAVPEDNDTLVALRLMLDLELEDRIRFALHPQTTNRDFDAGAAAALTDFKAALEDKIKESRPLFDKRMKPAL